MWGETMHLEKDYNQKQSKICGEKPIRSSKHFYIFQENQYNLVDILMLSKKNITIWFTSETPKPDLEEKSHFIVKITGLGAKSRKPPALENPCKDPTIRC